MHRNMNARNFGLGSRDINKAATNALRERELSYASVATMTERWRHFSRWLREIHQVKDLRWISQAHLKEYGRHIADRVRGGELSIATAQNYLSAVNVVLAQARQDTTVSIKPAECVGQRSTVCTTNKATQAAAPRHPKGSREVHPWDRRMAALRALVDGFGLRIKEASLLDARQALRQAESQQRIRVVCGTKGGRPRWVPITADHQLAVLREAARTQGRGRSVMPVDTDWKRWRQHVYRRTAALGLPGWHGGRHDYAQRRYQTLARVPCPVVAGRRHGHAHLRLIADTLRVSTKMARAIDRAVRLTVAEELGHGRPDVTNTYLG